MNRALRLRIRARAVGVLAGCALVQGCFCDEQPETRVRIAGDTTVLSTSLDVFGLTVMAGDTVPIEAQAMAVVRGDDCSASDRMTGPSSIESPAAYRWSSNAPATAAVDAAGRIAAVAVGQAVVFAEPVRGGAGTAMNVRVVPRIARMTISPLTATVAVGDTVSFLIATLDAAGRVLPPVPFPTALDPVLVWPSELRDHVVNLIRAVPERVLLLGNRAGEVPLTIRSLIYGLHRVPQDTATLRIVAR